MHEITLIEVATRVEALHGTSAMLCLGRTASGLWTARIKVGVETIAGQASTSVEDAVVSLLWPEVSP